MLTPLSMIARLWRRARAARRASLLLPVLSALTVLAVLLMSGPARAQAVTGIVGSVLRLEPNGTSADANGNGHPVGVGENVINYADCEADLSFQFTLSLAAAVPQYDLVAWVGTTDCTAVASRSGTSATCWPLRSPQLAPVSQAPGVGDGGVPTAQFDIRMQDIVQQAGVSPITPSYPAATATACTVQTLTAASSLSIYFFYTDHIGAGGGDAIGVAQAYPITVDTVAQNVGSGGFSATENVDSQFDVNIGVPPDPDTVSFNIYCDPPPGQTPVASSVPYDAASNNGICPSGAAGDGPVDSSPSSSIDSAATDSAGKIEDSSTTADVSSSEEASVSDASMSVDASPIEDSGPKDAETIADSGSPVDEAGGNGCGAVLNDSGIPGDGTCSGSILQSGGGTTTTQLEPAYDDAGNLELNEAGAQLYVEASVVVGGKETTGIPGKYLCATVAASSASYTLTGLKDGFSYVIGVAAVDSSGNVGPLALQCKALQQLGDFWYDYGLAGGQAGGGYCSTAEGVGVPAGTSGIALVMVASVIGLSRRRRKGAKRQS